MAETKIKWLLVETLGGGTQPSVIAIGRSSKPFVPLRKILRHHVTLTEAKHAITEVVVQRRSVDRISADGQRRTIAVPVAISPTRLHGVMLWSGHPDAAVPPRDPAGAWKLDLTDGTGSRSDDVLAILGVPPDRRPGLRRHSIAAVFGSPNIVNASDPVAALARLVRAEHGTETQSLWTVRRPGGDLRALHYSCRHSTTPDHNGTVRKLVRGIVYDIGPAAEIPAAPTPTSLERLVLEAAAADGEYRVIFDPNTLHPLRWIGHPVPGIAWQGTAGQPAPAVHPDDLTTARAMIDGRPRGRLRLRALDGPRTARDARATPITHAPAPPPAHRPQPHPT
uniref:GAF domain-containing protein n=1 Tax=Nocardia wallacei TaxID=480035 RepID=UPI002458819C